MAITHSDYSRARYICEEAALNLAEAIYPDNRGGRSMDPLIFVVGLFLAMDHYNAQYLTKVYEVLTRDLPVIDQWHLGVRSQGSKTGEVKVLCINDLYQLSKRITRQLDFSPKRCGHLPTETRHSRREHLDNFVCQMLRPTLPERPEGSIDYALDGTGIWASEKGKAGKKKDAGPQVCHEELIESETLIGDESSTIGGAYTDSSSPSTPSKIGRGCRGVSDARWGYKTAKSGESEKYFGYDVETITRVPKIRNLENEVRTEPALIQSLVVIPASVNMVNPCLRMIDRMAGQKITVGSLLVDRAYSHKKYVTWATELIRRGISQVIDLRDDDQGFKDWSGMKIAASWAHCPSTPNRLGEILTLGPKPTEEASKAFTANIMERQAYAAQRVSPLSADGKIRFSCPAKNGTIGCPLREGTVATAISLGLPVVSNPPGEIGRPSICSQETVQLRVETEGEQIAMKLNQKHYWGSPAWRLSYNRRTYVEGTFGVFKSATATGHDRGTHQFQGLPLVTISVAVSAAVTNLRLLRKWNEETGLGDPLNPLLIPDPEFHGLLELNAEGAQAIDDEFLARV